MHLSCVVDLEYLLNGGHYTCLSGVSIENFEHLQGDVSKWYKPNEFYYVCGVC
jgi:hypothetical protein